MKKITVLAVVLVLLTALIVTATVNPVLFHTVVEGYALIVSALIFVLGTRTYKHSGNNLLLFLGWAFLFIAVVDSFHLMTYPGLLVFQPISSSVSVHFGLVARFIEAFTLLAAVSFLDRQAPRGKMYLAYAAVIVLLLQFVPRDAISQIICGLLIFVVFLVSLFRFYIHRYAMDRVIYQSLVISLAASILSEFLFVIGYSETIGWVSCARHLLKVVSYLSITYGIVVHGLDRPFELISAKLLEERSRASQEFIQIMTHELRNPLTAIKGMCALLTFQISTGREVTGLQSKLTVLESEVDHLSSLIDEISDAFRSHQGRLKLEKTQVNMVSVVKSALAAVQALDQSSNYSFQGEELYDIAEVNGDPKRLQEVVRNLVGNAYKYSAKGTQIEIRLECERESLIVSVADHGVGIPPDQQEQIFDGFFRARNLDSHDPGGMGLGLYICKNIVEQHGGRIWVKSIEGRGSTFYFSLPRLKQTSVTISTTPGDGLPVHQ